MTDKDKHKHLEHLDPPSPIEDLATAYRTLFVDLPLAEARWWMGIGSEHEVLDAVWTEYDALTHLASAAFDPQQSASSWPDTAQQKRTKSHSQQQPKAKKSPN